MHTIYRRELGVNFAVYPTEHYASIVALGSFTDAATYFDHRAFVSRWSDVARDKVASAELRAALRRHARWVKSLAVR